MGICVSKHKHPHQHQKSNSNGQKKPIQYTMSPGYAAQIPNFNPNPTPPPPPHKANTILGNPYEDIKAHYTLGKELGRGQFGVIHLCTDISTGNIYACKSISKRKLITRNDKDDMSREVQIMQHLSGQPNIVEFRGAYEDKHSVHLVMELCACGELFDRIIAKGHYSERAAAAASLK